MGLLVLFGQHMLLVRNSRRVVRGGNWEFCDLSQLHRERLSSQKWQIRSIVEYRRSSPCAGRNFQEISECGPRCGPEQYEVRCGDSIDHGGPVNLSADGV